jgi:hypothetical protein
MYVSRTKFNYKITKNTAIITGTLSVNSRNKMLKSQCASKHEINTVNVKQIIRVIIVGKCQHVL